MILTQKWLVHLTGIGETCIDHIFILNAINDISPAITLCDKGHAVINIC